MKTLVMISLIGLSLSSVRPGLNSSTDPDPDRFAVSIKGKIGFINRSGEVVIKPQYSSVQDFSEGLCAVRTEGTYGFIDGEGIMRISAQYDYATEFREGLALVYIEGRPLFIDKKGNKAFESVYKSMSHFHNGKSNVRTNSNKEGVITRTGQLLIDTIYKSVGSFEDGLAIVNGLNHQPYESEGKKIKFEISVINDKGELLVPFGKLTEISKYNEGFFNVSLPAKKGANSPLDGFMNCEGKITYVLPEKEISWLDDGGVHNGIARVNLPYSKGKNRSDKFYEAYITPYGKPVYQDREVEFGRDFSEGFAFYASKRGSYTLINSSGKVIAKNRFDRVTRGGFHNGKALVKTAGGWGVIDTTASFIMKPKFERVFEGGIIDDLIFFEDTAKEESRDNPKYGISDLMGNIIVPPSFQYFDRRGFVNGLLKTWINNQLAYFNREGKIVWKEEEWEPQELQALDIDYMNRGYFYANYNFTGHGNSPSRAEAEKIRPYLNFENSTLSIAAHPDPEMEFGTNKKGMIIYVANTTNDTIYFAAQDSRLYMKVQALDTKGEWRDIEYLPSSWCGNSYHSVDLPANHFWTFVAPKYKGSYRTTLRVELTYIDPKKPAATQKDHKEAKKELTIYSNEFEGNINPAQFWRKPGYSPSGIMDPYNE